MNKKMWRLVVAGLLIVLAVSALGVSDIRVSAATTATVTVNASTVTHTIPDALWGANLAAWESTESGTNTTFNNLLINQGSKYYRWPGGSWGDIDIWDNMACNGSWVITYQQTLNLLSAVGGTMQPIVNSSGYWCGTQHTQAQAVQEAANWVTDMNVTRHLGVKYWEIGNEVYGSWEQGNTDGTTYGNRYVAFYKAMKAVDPTI